MNKVPLNQSYKTEKTFKDYPDIKIISDDYKKFCLEEAKWHKVGRWYDCSMSLYSVDFEDKTVCELGARDSIFSSYLTKLAKEVHVSDTFIGWGDLGSLPYWTDLWKKFAYKPERLFCEYQDMKKLSYFDESMDVVISFSAIEHIPGNGDIEAAKEMARVCKPGGTIIIGTDMSRSFCWQGGGYFYDEKNLFKRLIYPTKCTLIGPYDFNVETANKAEIYGIEYCSAIFLLRKPERNS